ncbi:hypothetical protein JI58_08920 [Marinosulfonomonas sp. PRT-SC04]|nr:hypothetical protein JI58_08920 [Marinosulfonomonas sp. PRT-SC04]
MTFGHRITGIIAISAIFALTACGGGSQLGSGSIGSAGESAGGSSAGSLNSGSKATPQANATPRAKERSTIWDLLKDQDDPNTTIKVNKYIWNAALDVLDFLPVQTVDPFSGIISTGYGTPPGGGRAYKATIYIQDPALDARSLNIALRTRSGVASAETVRAIEDAILTRARQLRIRDGKL